MGNINFAWDARKAKTNLAKHGISFEEAETSFLDVNARLLDDPDHSESEERFLLLGLSIKARCLTVSHCYREPGGIIRIVSARPATIWEEQTYWSFQ